MAGRGTLAVLALATLHGAAAWVLYVPYNRGNLGIAYSNAAAGDATKDWSGPNNNPLQPDLNALSLRWGAPLGPLPDGKPNPEALGMGLTYALDPTFCDLMLPKFPEDGAQSGSLDGFISALSCNNLQAAIHTAFGTWATNNPHISFVDRTEECAQPGMIANGKCSRAEILIGAEDLTQTTNFVAYFQPDTSNSPTTGINWNPTLTSGLSLDAPAKGIGMRSGTIKMTTASCWYLDTTFCTTLHSVFSSMPGFETPFFLTCVVITGIAALTVVYIFFRFCLASMGFHSAKKRKGGLVAAARETVVETQQATQAAVRAVTRRRSSARPSPSSMSPNPNAKAAQAVAKWGGGGGPSMSPPPSCHASPPPSPPSAQVSAPPASDIMKLNVAANATIDLALNQADRQKMRDYARQSQAQQQQIRELYSGGIPFSVQGPQRALGLLRRIRTLPKGTMSPPRPLTLSWEQRRAAGIPPRAERFAFAYPLDFPLELFDSPKAKQDLLQMAATEPWVFFVLLGGFVYFDWSGKAIQVNALSLSASSSSLNLVGPLPADAAPAQHLSNTNRLQDVTLADLRSKGYRRFGWVNPAEILNGKPLTTAVEYPHGAFVYVMEDESAIMFVLAQGNDAVVNAVRAAMAEVERKASAEQKNALLIAANAMQGNIKGLYDGWQGALKNVLKDFDIEQREQNAFDAEETYICHSKTMTHIVVYMAQMPIATLLLALFWLFATPIFYLRVFLPCWDCYDFQAMVAHEVGHLLGFDHPDLKQPMNLHSKYSMNSTTCIDPLQYVELTPYGDANAGSIMHSETLRRSVNCLTADDLEGLDAIYPDCGISYPERDPVCHVEKNLSGWLRLALAIGIPFILTTVLLTLPICIVKNYQKRRVAALETALKGMKAKSAWQKAGHNVRGKILSDKAKSRDAQEKMHAVLNLAKIAAAKAEAEAAKLQLQAARAEAAMNLEAVQKEMSKQAVHEAARAMAGAPPLGKTASAPPNIQPVAVADGDTPRAVLPPTPAAPPSYWGRLVAIGSKDTSPDAVYELKGSENGIGRKASCLIRINNGNISSVHCKITLQMGSGGRGEVWIEDFSSNGTFVNERRVGKGHKVKLEHNDEIGLLMACGAALPPWAYRFEDMTEQFHPDHLEAILYPNGPPVAKSPPRSSMLMSIRGARKASVFAHKSSKDLHARRASRDNTSPAKGNGASATSPPKSPPVQPAIAEDADQIFKDAAKSLFAQDATPAPVVVAAPSLPPRSVPHCWARLLCIGANEAESSKVVELTTAKMSIGRKPECLIQLNDGNVSSTHCSITLTKGKGGLEMWLEDTSSNGTFVNEKSIGKGKVSKLKHGDVVGLLAPASGGAGWAYRVEDRIAEVPQELIERVLTPLSTRSALPNLDA